VEIKKKKQLLMSQIFDHALMSFSSVSEHISQGSLYTTTKYKTKKIITAATMVEKKSLGQPHPPPPNPKASASLTLD